MSSGRAFVVGVVLASVAGAVHAEGAQDVASRDHWAQMVARGRTRIAEAVASDEARADSVQARRSGLGGAAAVEARGVDACGGECYGVLEGEIAGGLCEDSTNGGCFGTIPVFGRMEVGVPTCGLLNGQDGAPPIVPACTDTDWYRISLETGASYIIDITAEVDVLIGVVADIGNVPLLYDGDPFAFCADAFDFVDGGLTVLACNRGRTLVSVPTDGEYVFVVFGPGGDIGVAHYEVVINSCAIDCVGSDTEGVLGEVANLGACDSPGWDPVNGGCSDTATLPFDMLQLNVPLCGASDYNGACRDTDWFLVDIPHAGDFDIELTCDRTMDVGVVLGAGGLQYTSSATFCPAVDFASAITVLACTTDALRFNFPSAGTYVVFVAPSFFFDTGPRSYRLRVIDTLPPCPADINRNGTVDLDDLQILLFWFGATSC